jgi:hypothetical protein
MMHSLRMPDLPGVSTALACQTGLLYDVFDVTTMSLTQLLQQKQYLKYVAAVCFSLLQYKATAELHDFVHVAYAATALPWQ